LLAAISDRGPRRIKTYPPSALIHLDHAEVAGRKRTAVAEAAYQAMLRGQRRRNRRGRASLRKRRTA